MWSIARILSFGIPLTLAGLAFATPSDADLLDALADWAWIPVQMRVNKAFQRTLIDRLMRTTLELAKHVA